MDNPNFFILVGVTGVGKSSTIEALRTLRPIHLLPDRRQLTDEIIIPTVQAAAGEVLRPITDRTERFAYTRRYRQLHPEGMSYALAELTLPPASADLLIFDGLRGANEVRSAAALLPSARFLFLDAPDAVRVRRLLGRGDAFDRVVTDEVAETLDPALYAGILSAEQAASLLQQVAQGAFTLADLTAKLAIVREEKRSYDPVATLATLRQAAPDRLIYADTTQLTSLEIAHLLLATLTD